MEFRLIPTWCSLGQKLSEASGVGGGVEFLARIENRKSRRTLFCLLAPSFLRTRDRDWFWGRIKGCLRHKKDPGSTGGGFSALMMGLSFWELETERGCWSGGFGQLGSLGSGAVAGFGGILAARLSGRRTSLAAKEETLPAPKQLWVSH